MVIAKLRVDDKQVVRQIVDVHMETFRGFFLTFMGSGFLRKMYSSYTEHDASDILVAVQDDRLVGFLAYSENMSGLYKHMIKKHLVAFAWYSFLAFLRKPKVFVRLIRAFLKPSESTRDEAYVELASIGVSPHAKNMGVGSELIRTLQQTVDFDRFDYISLETDAVDNEAANHFYVKNGFVLHRQFVTREGREMNEYHFRP